MKTFTSFLVTLFLLTLIGGCDNSTGAGDKFESRQIGNWYLKTKHTAQYNPETTQKAIAAPSSDSATTDTINITSPQQVNVAITTSEDSSRGTFVITFIDSSLTESYWVSHDLTGTLDIQSSDSNLVDIHNTYTSAVPAEEHAIIQAYFLGDYGCDGSSFDGIFYYSIFEHDTRGAPIKVYRLDARGFQQTLDIMTGCTR